MIRKKRQVIALPIEKAILRGLLLEEDGMANWNTWKINYNPKLNEDAERYKSMGGIRWQPYHLYFIVPSILEDKVNGEEIKDGDWAITRRRGELFQATKENNHPIYGDRKVIATTNPNLWLGKRNSRQVSMETDMNWNAKGIREEDLHFYYEKGVPKIPTDFVEAFVKQQGIWEVELEYDDHLPDTDRNYGTIRLNSQGAVCVYPVKEKMYTREELRNACVRTLGNCKHLSLMSQIDIFNEWFDKNHPK